jgi:hypothetical protein
MSLIFIRTGVDCTGGFVKVDTKEDVGKALLGEFRLR